MRHAELQSRHGGSRPEYRVIAWWALRAFCLLLAALPQSAAAQTPAIAPYIVWEREERAAPGFDIMYYTLGKLSPTRLVLAGAQWGAQAIYPRLLFVRPNGDTIGSRLLTQLPWLGSQGIQQIVPNDDGSFLAIAHGGDSTSAFLRLFQIDSTGGLEWEQIVRTADASNRPEWRTPLAVPDGYLLQTYQMVGPQSIGHGTLIKVNRQGEYQWRLTLGRWSDMGNGTVLPCPDGSYVVSAASTSRYPLPHLIPWDYERLMLRIHPNGTVLDSAHLGTPNAFEGSGTTTPTPDGGFFVTATRIAQPLPRQPRRYDGHLLKLDSQFRKQWEVRLPSAVAGRGWQLYDGQALTNGNYRAIGYTSIPGPTSAGTYVGAVVEIAPPAGTGPADTLGRVVREWTHTNRFWRILPQPDGTAYVAGVGSQNPGNQRYYAKLAGLGRPAPAPDLCARRPRLGQAPTFQPAPARPDSLVFALDSLTTRAGPRYGVVSRVTWDFGDGTPTQDGWRVGHVFAAPTPVRVRVCVLNNLWCRTCTDVYPFGPLSVRQEGQERVTVYPNPSANGVFTVRAEAAPGRTLLVLDALGRIVGRASAADAQTRVDLSAQPAGVYLLRLTWPDGHTFVQRLVRW